MLEEKQEELKRQKDIGQFFTPQEVVSFIYNMLAVHLDKEEKWKKRKFPSIIDPACGEGVFLKVALDKEITKPIYVFGVDLDEKVKEKWIEINLLKSFGSKAELDIHFYHQNGLLPLPEKTLRYKRGGLNQYDLVVGNPPYGGVGLQVITRQLHDTLLKYEIWRRASRQNSNKQNDNAFLFEEMPENLSKDQEERLKRFPIEILFVERFIQLCKPGGRIAIIIPDGILSNSNLHYVREFISEKMRVNAIVSLPRGTFKDVGTSAKTSILFMTKPREGEKIADNYKILLASVERSEYLNKVYEHYKEVNEMNSSKKDLVKVINDSQGNEVAMVRVDKTLKEMMEEKPNSRWDPLYWHPQHEEMAIATKKFSFEPLGNFISYSTCGYRGKTEFSDKGTPCIEALCVLASGTGVDITLGRRLPKNAKADAPNRRTQLNDLLFVRSGVGCAGRTAVVSPSSTNCIIGGHIFRVQLKNIEPAVVHVWLKTEFGKLILNRFRTGVGALVLDESDIKSIPIPILSPALKRKIVEEFEKVIARHERAIVEKNEGNDKGYNQHIETAEKLLKDLIVRTEAVIRGEKEDVI